MDPAPTLVNGFQWTFQFIGQIAFQWVPSVVLTLKNTGTPEGVMYPPPPLGVAPATAYEAADYLQAVSTTGTYEVLSRNWGIFVVLSLFVSLLLATFVIYCVIRILQIRHREHLKFAAAQQTVAAHDVPRSQLRWNRIKEEVSSDEEQKMRLAILEADIMLNELLDTLGYKGETMGDKMRLVDRANFNTIDIAW